jgi:GMP synthase-like glutamine amidotransferase
MRALVLQHVACESPGVYEDVLREHGWSALCVELDNGGRLPEAGEFDALIAMGGPMSANDEASLPWLAAEKRLIARAVRAGVPFWGVCLGAQLLAASLGAPVYGGAELEVGVCGVALTEAAFADPVFGGLPPTLPTLQWHGESFDLPAGAVRLARSDLYRNQAFRVGERAYALQFHLEASADMAGEWLALPEYREALERALGPGGGDRLRRELGAAQDVILNYAREAFARWLELATPAPGGRAGRAPG